MDSDRFQSHLHNSSGILRQTPPSFPKDPHHTHSVLPTDRPTSRSPATFLVSEWNESTELFHLIVRHGRRSSRLSIRAEFCSSPPSHQLLLPHTNPSHLSKANSGWFTGDPPCTFCAFPKGLWGVRPSLHRPSLSLRGSMYSLSISEFTETVGGYRRGGRLKKKKTRVKIFKWITVKILVWKKHIYASTINARTHDDNVCNSVHIWIFLKFWLAWHKANSEKKKEEMSRLYWANYIEKIDL